MNTYIFLGYAIIAHWMDVEHYYQWYQYSFEPVLWDETGPLDTATELGYTIGGAELTE